MDSAVGFGRAGVRVYKFEEEEGEPVSCSYLGNESLDMREACRRGSFQGEHGIVGAYHFDFDFCLGAEVAVIRMHCFPRSLLFWELVCCRAGGVGEWSCWAAVSENAAWQGGWV